MIENVQGKPRMRTKPGGRRAAFSGMRHGWDLLLFCLPGLVITFIYHYIPLYGVQIAFRQYSMRGGISGSPWVGWRHFEAFFNAPDFWQIIGNTFILSLYGMLASFPVAILLALMLNAFRHQRYRRVIQAVTYAPFFISVVVMCGMILLFLSPRVGVVNVVIKSLGGEAINFMGKAAYWRHIYVWTGVWQRMGWNSVIYFAALSAVSPEFHEAAIVDGATKLQRVRYIDLPALKPVALMLLILNLGEFFNVSYEKVAALQNDLNMSVSDIISTYVFRKSMGANAVNQSYPAAVGLFSSVINTVMLITTNWIVRKSSEHSLF